MNTKLFLQFHRTLLACTVAGLLLVGLLNWQLGVELNPTLFAAILGASALAAFARQPA